MAKSDLLNGLASVAMEGLAKSASGKSSTTKKTTTSTTKKTTASKTSTTKKITPASGSSSKKSTETTKSGLGDLVGGLASSLGGGFDLSSLLTGAVTNAISSNVSQSALGFSDVNGDGKVDLTDILQTIIKSFQGGKIDVKSISSAITNVWNTAFKAGQDSKK